MSDVEFGLKRELVYKNDKYNFDSNTNQFILINPIEKYEYISCGTIPYNYYDRNPVVERYSCIWTMKDRIMNYEEHIHSDNTKLYRVRSADFTEKDFIKYFVDQDFTSKDLLVMNNVEMKSSILNELGWHHILTPEHSLLLDTMEDISVITNNIVTYELYDIDIQVNPYIAGRIVVVEDHTTHKKAFLSVPRIRDTVNCRGAIAWTFGLKPSEYKPIMES